MGDRLLSESTSLPVIFDSQMAARGLTEVGKKGVRSTASLGLDPRNTLFIIAGDSTAINLTQAAGFNARMAQLTSPGAAAEGLYGWVNMGSSGYELSKFVNDPAISGWGGPVAGNADWNFVGVKQNTPAGMATPMANLLPFLAGLDSKITPVVALPLGVNDVGKNLATGQLSQSALEAFYVALLRTAAEAIHAARANAIILPVVQQRILARPYGGQVPATAVWNGAGAPGFGTDLTADTALLTKWNTALLNAKAQVASEYSYTALWDWQKEVFGYPVVDVDTPTTWPFYADNVHQSAPAANTLAESITRLMFGNRLAVPVGRLRLADKLAVVNGLTVEEQYARYCEGHPDRYSRVFDGVLSACGSTYLEIAFQEASSNGSATALFATALKGKTPIYVQVGDAVCQRFTSFSASANGAAAVRLLGTAPSAAMQALTGQSLPVRVYVNREAGTGDSYVDGLAFDRSTYRKAYTGTVGGAGNGYIDVQFDAVSKSGDTLFRINQLRSLAGLKLALGGAVGAIQDLSTGWSPSTYTPASRIIRLLNTGDKTTWSGAKFALLVDQSANDPAVQDQVESLGVAAPLANFSATTIVRRYYPGLTSFTFHTGIQVASTVAFTVSKISGNVKTALASGTVAANGYTATVTFTAWDARPGELVVVDVTAIGGTGPAYSGAAVISGLLS